MLITLVHADSVSSVSVIYTKGQRRRKFGEKSYKHSDDIASNNRLFGYILA